MASLSRRTIKNEKGQTTLMRSLYRSAALVRRSPLLRLHKGERLQKRSPPSLCRAMAGAPSVALSSYGGRVRRSPLAPPSTFRLQKRSPPSPAVQTSSRRKSIKAKPAVALSSYGGRRWAEVVKFRTFSRRIWRKSVNISHCSGWAEALIEKKN